MRLRSFAALYLSLGVLLFSTQAALAEDLLKGANHLFQWESLTFECSTCAAVDLETCELFLSGEHVLVPCEMTTLLLLQETLQLAKGKHWNQQHPSPRELLLFALSARTTLELKRLALELLITTEQGGELIKANIPLISALSEPWRAEFLKRASPFLGPPLRTSERVPSSEQSTEPKVLALQNPGALSQVEQALIEPASGPLPGDNNLSTYAGLLAFGLGLAGLARLLRRRFFTRRPKLPHAERVELRELQTFFKLKRSFSRDELKTQYRKLARTVHPDLNHGRAEEFIRLSERYQRAEHLLSKASVGRKGRVLEG